MVSKIDLCLEKFRNNTLTMDCGYINATMAGNDDK